MGGGGEEGREEAPELIHFPLELTGEIRGLLSLPTETTIYEGLHAEQRVKLELPTVPPNHRRQGQPTHSPGAAGRPRARAAAQGLTALPLFSAEPVSCLAFGIFSYTGRGRPLGLVWTQARLRNGDLSPPRNRAHPHPDPRRATVLGARADARGRLGSGLAAFGVH